MIDIKTMKPLNKTAALVVSKGIHKPNILKNNNYNLYNLKPPIRKGLDFDINRVGRLTIIGYIDTNIFKMSKNNKNRIVVKCDCGNYEIKSAKYLKEKTLYDHMCSECNDFENKKRTDFWKQYGFDKENQKEV